jgi:hypothetical protein
MKPTSCDASSLGHTVLKAQFEETLEAIKTAYIKTAYPDSQEAPEPSALQLMVLPKHSVLDQALTARYNAEKALQQYVQNLGTLIQITYNPTLTQEVIP